ncbi:lipopolysaccharide biosynthesis protein [bacterium]|nr:lipopolysaccharide biosynthesis protein [bacterium]
MIDNKDNSITKKKAVSGIIWKFLERICAQGISLIVSIILARILIPKDYSVVSVITIFFAFANVIISGGLNAALIQKKDADRQDYSTVLFLSVFISIIIYFILFFTAPLIAKAYDQEILIPIIRVMSLVLPVNAIKSIYCAYISSTLQFKKFFFATLGGTLASGVVGITMALKGFGSWALVAQQMTNAVIDTIILIFVAKLRIVFSFSFPKLKVLFKYGWKVFLSSFINTAYIQSKPLFIGLRFSSIDLSYYTKGSSFPNLISETTTNTLSAVLFPTLSKVQDNKETLLNWTRRFIKTTSFICFPCMLGLFAVSDNFVFVLLTEKWMEASFYIKIFAITGMFSMIHIGNCETIKAMGRSDIYLRMEIIKKVSYFAILGIFMIFSNNPHVLAMSSFLTTAVALLVNSFPNRKLIDYKFKYQVLDVLINLLPAVAMCVCVYFLGYLPISAKWLILIIQVLAGVIIYFGICFLLKNENLLFLAKLIKEFFKNRKKNKSLD